MKKKLLVAAIGSCLAAVATVDQAESLLFPYFESGNGVFSFLSLVNTDPDTEDVRLHYIWTVDYLDTPDEIECEHNDGYGAMTKNDLIHQTVLGPGSGGLDLPALAGDSHSSPAYFTVSPVRGYMIVSAENVDNTGVVTGDGTGESTLAGQMTVVDANTGFILSQKGLNNPGQDTEAQAGNWNNILTSHSTYDMTWYPAAVVNTSWYTLVTGVNMDVGNAWEGAVQMNNGYGSAGITYDHDENPVSGNIPVNIVCYALLNREDFLTAHQVNETSMGGYYWSVFATARNDFDTTATKRFDSTGVLMEKMETTDLMGGVGTANMENAWPNIPY